MSNYLARLQKDLNRPAGGWTMGFALGIAGFAGPIIAWGVSEAAGAAWMLACLIGIVWWGNYGYIPARF